MKAKAGVDVAGEIVKEIDLLPLGEVCLRCKVHPEMVRELVDYGVVDLTGYRVEEWRLSGASLRRIQRAVRLQRDLNINLSGTALVPDLLERIDWLETRLTLEQPRRPS